MSVVFHRLILLFLILTLTGCGFHLRRPHPLPSVLSEVILLPDAVYTPLYREMTNQLREAGSIVVPAGTQGVPVITLLGDSYSNITLSVGSDGQTREKLLIYSLNFQLTDVQNNLVIPPNTIRLNRVIKYDPNFVLAKGYEEDKMIHDMRADAVEQVITQLSHLSSSQIQLTPAPTNPLGSAENQDEITQSNTTQSPNRDVMPYSDTDIVGD